MKRFFFRMKQAFSWIRRSPRNGHPRDANPCCPQFVGGAVPANKALDLAKGRWIARNDDDDIWTPEHLETLLRFAQKGNWEFVSASYITERHGKRITVDAKDEKPRIGGVQTWLYRSYLKFMKYNPECWRKSWNRVWDTDLQDRIYRAGVRMGFLDQVVAYVLPRPGEATVGLEAYKLSEKDKLEHYKFNSKKILLPYSINPVS